MVVATLHLGRSGYGRWGGREVGDHVPLVTVGVVPRFVRHAVSPGHHGSQTLFDDRWIALVAAGLRPVMVVMRKSQVIGLPESVRSNSG